MTSMAVGSLKTTAEDIFWPRFIVKQSPYRSLQLRMYESGCAIQWINLLGIGYGTPGSWRNRGATFPKALDADISTYFDGPAADGDYIGINTGTATP